jgi:hypothetical protein
MSQAERIVIGICVLIIVYVLTRKYQTWRTGLAYKSVVADLRNKGAFGPSTAVTLPYSHQSVFRVGMKDYRPKAIEYLVASYIVGVTETGNYYLAKKDVVPRDS